MSRVHDATLFTEPLKGKLWVWTCILVPHVLSCSLTSVSESCNRKVIRGLSCGQGDRQDQHPPAPEQAKWSVNASLTSRFLSIPRIYSGSPLMLSPFHIMVKRTLATDTWKLAAGTQPTWHLQDKSNHAKGLECLAAHPFEASFCSLISGHGLDVDSVAGKRLCRENQAPHP